MDGKNGEKSDRHHGIDRCPNALKIKKLRANQVGKKGHFVVQVRTLNWRGKLDKRHDVGRITPDSRLRDSRLAKRLRNSTFELDDGNINLHELFALTQLCEADSESGDADPPPFCRSRTANR